MQLSLVVSSHRPSPGLGIERRLVLSSAQNQLGHRAVVGEEREERMMVVTVEHYSGVRERRGRRGGYLSVSWSLHCPGQTELAYRARVSAQPPSAHLGPHQHQHRARTGWAVR